MITAARPRLLFMLVAVLALIGCAAGPGVPQGAYDDLIRQVGNLERRLETIEARDGQMANVLARARGATAYIWGAYTFVDKEGRPLRHVVDAKGRPVADPEGTPLVDVQGRGPIAVENYCGTAFLVGAEGEMLTNRHLAEPWWEDDESAPLLAAGMKPVFLRLRAFFQERSGGVPIEVLRVDGSLDIALVKTVGWVPAARPLVLHPNPERVEGQPIFLIGFPSGLEAVIAKLDVAEQTALGEETGACSYNTAELLSAQKRLRPSITGGILWEVLPHLMIYDARTIGGGSGGPLLDRDGQVLGVNAAYLEDFQGGNYGVPAGFGRRLLAGSGLIVREACGESKEILVRYESDEEKNITFCKGGSKLP
jgi:S1-C subfamily serine protease